jgi:hypothetical protein
MTKKDETIDVQAILRTAIQVGFWRFVNDSEHAAAVAALAKIVGREAKLPTWQRRLAVAADGSQFLLVVDSCLQKHSSCINWDPLASEALRPIPCALPIEAAVKLLQSPQSPELELQQRLAAAHKREAERAAREAAEAEKFRLKTEAEVKERREQEACRATEWERLTPMERFAARLAVLVESRDKDLAADIRSALDTADVASDFPRAQWWTGLDGLMAAKHAQAVVASIPTEKLALLRLMHGNDTARLARAWTEMNRPQQGKAA